MLEILLNEIKQGLLELGRFFCLVYLVWYFLAVLWFIVNPRVSWLYRVNHYSNNSTKDSYISSWNVFQYKFLKMIVIIFYSIIEPMEVLLRLPKAIKRSHNTTASRNMIMITTLEELPLKKVHKKLDLWFNKHGEWYTVDFDEVWIFVKSQPSSKNVKLFHNKINSKVLKQSGKLLELTFPEYRTGEINVLYMKIVEVKK
ncbi:hypothetical protein HO875_02630 [Streptococcus suis]|nr:hypothetical protein [Streptococcus suis]